MIILVAFDENRLIGNSQSNDLPWHLPEDLKLFKQRTMGHSVVMGRLTYDSIPEKYRPLPGRMNWVITRNAIQMHVESFPFRQCHYVYDVDEVITDTEIFVIGGAQIYQMALDSGLVTKMIVSEVKGKHEGDVYFPEFDEADWQRVVLSEHEGFNTVEYLKCK